MGAAGAAIATTIGNILASIYYLWYFMKKSKSFSVSPKYFKCGEQVLTRVCSIGFPTAIFSALMSVSTIVLNQILVKYGNAPVAAIGIVFKANMFITFLQMGLANGVQPSRNVLWKGTVLRKNAVWALESWRRHYFSFFENQLSTCSLTIKTLYIMA